MNIKKGLRIGVYILAIIGFFVVIDTSNSLFGIGLLALIVIASIITINRLFSSKKAPEKTTPNLSMEKEQHYQDLGMDHKQIDFFRDTMATAKKQIIQLDRNMQSVAKLKAIDLRNDTLKAAKGMFKELVKNPNKLHQADRFLYNHLPNLVDLTNKYLEINDHDVKTKNTFEALEKSSYVIDDVSKLLVSDYELFVSDDLEELDVEITIAQQNLAREKEMQERLDALAEFDLNEKEN